MIESGKEYVKRFSETNIAAEINTIWKWNFLFHSPIFNYLRRDIGTLATRNNCIFSVGIYLEPLIVFWHQIFFATYAKSIITSIKNFLSKRVI
jgi:hypothetical protein